MKKLRKTLIERRKIIKNLLSVNGYGSKKITERSSLERELVVIDYVLEELKTTR